MSSTNNSDYSLKFRKLNEAYTDFMSITKSTSNQMRGGFYSKDDIFKAKKDINNIYKQAADIRSQTNELNSIKNKKLSQSDRPTRTKIKVVDNKLSKSEKKAPQNNEDAMINHLNQFVESTTLGFQSKSLALSAYEKLHQNPKISGLLEDLSKMEKSGSVNSKSLNNIANELETELNNLKNSSNYGGLREEDLEFVDNLLQQIHVFKYQHVLEKSQALADPILRTNSPLTAREAFTRANFPVVENAIQASQMQKTGKLLSTSTKDINADVIANIKFGSAKANAAVAKTIPYLFEDYGNTTISESKGILKFSNPTLGSLEISLEDWKNADRSKIPLTPQQKNKYEELVKGAIKAYQANASKPDLKKSFNPKSDTDFLYNQIYDNDASFHKQAVQLDSTRLKKAESLKKQGRTVEAEQLLKDSHVEAQKNLSLAEKMAVRVYSTDDGCSMINGINRGFVKDWSSDKLKEAMMHSFVFAHGLELLPPYQFVQGSFGYRGEKGSFEWGDVLQQKIDNGDYINVNTGFTSMSYATSENLGGEKTTLGPSTSFFNPAKFNKQDKAFKSRWGTVYSNPQDVKDVTALSCFADKERELVRKPGIEKLMGTMKADQAGENLTLLNIRTLDYATLVDPSGGTSPAKPKPSTDAPPRADNPQPGHLDQPPNLDNIYKERQ